MEEELMREGGYVATDSYGLTKAPVTKTESPTQEGGGL